MEQAKRGGRKKGSLNRITVGMKAIAGVYGQEAVDMLVLLMRTSENDAIRARCANDLLDRGFGRPTQAIELGGRDGAPQVTINIVKSKEAKNVDRSVQAEE